MSIVHSNRRVRTDSRPPKRQQTPAIAVTVSRSAAVALVWDVVLALR
jgi:hypothetical protein